MLNHIWNGIKAALYWILICSLLPVILMIIVQVADASTPNREPDAWMLMVAPSASDIHLENHSVQVNTLYEYNDCRELAVLYIKDAYAWCKPLFIEPLNMVQELEAYHAK